MIKWIDDGGFIDDKWLCDIYVAGDKWCVDWWDAKHQYWLVLNIVGDSVEEIKDMMEEAFK